MARRITWIGVVLFLFLITERGMAMKESLVLELELTGGKKVDQTTRVYLNDGSIPVKIVFRNKGDGAIAILKQFEPLPVFFSFVITKEDGTIIDVPGAGKISLNEMKYITLKPGQAFDLSSDLKKVLPEPLALGKYMVSVEYHNQYGEGCFKGYLQSNTAVFVVMNAESYKAIPPTSSLP